MITKLVDSRGLRVGYLVTNPNAGTNLVIPASLAAMFNQQTASKPNLATQSGQTGYASKVRAHNQYGDVVCQKCLTLFSEAAPYEPKYIDCRCGNKFTAEPPRRSY